MPITDQKLWKKISAHRFGVAGGLDLAVQLERQTALRGKRAVAAVQEYRRFIYLAAIGPGPTVPSPVVDAVWHCHILNTHDYFDRLCAKVVGRTIHHNPGREAARHDPDYPATLARYAAEFGPPPPRIWPSPAILRGERLTGFMIAFGMMVAFLAFAGESWDLGLIGALFLVLSFGWRLGFGPWTPGNSGKSNVGCGDGGGCGDGCGGD